MAYSFVEIEKEKTRSIILLVILLIGLYFFTGWLLVFTLQNSFNYFIVKNRYLEQFVLSYPSAFANLITFCTAFLVGLTHYLFSTNRMIERCMLALDARPLNLNYPKHKQLQNVIEEVSVATGGANIMGCTITTTAFNAFAFGDEDVSYIGVTEGLLERATRSQLEGIVGHEAAHIASGDTFLNTITCSIFGVYEGLLRMISSIFRARIRGRAAGALYVVCAICYVVLFIMHTFNKILMAFISQQKEFRADAVAVRLTRNPMALAQALYLVSKKWRGQGLRSQTMSALFIEGMKKSRISLFATHPPIEQRIDILLNMAHADWKTLEFMCVNLKPMIKEVRTRANIRKRKLKKTKDQPSWHIFQDKQWKGPFIMAELDRFDRFNLDSIVRRHGSIETRTAREDRILYGRFSNYHDPSRLEKTCPHCYHGLLEIEKEGAQINSCGICEGKFVTPDELKKILIRQDSVRIKEVVEAANAISQDRVNLFRKYKQIETPFQLNCPKCYKKMRRRLFSHYAPIEIDECMWCGSIWFDADELEMIEYLHDVEAAKGVI